MKAVKIVLFILLSNLLNFPIYSQENGVGPLRTPEQEAVKQTEKLQQELNLSQDQAKQIYEINLRYAKERQISNKRSQALERNKNKNVEIQQVLSPDQNDKLQSKRYERSSIESSIMSRNLPNNSSGFRVKNQYRTTTTTDVNQRNNSRPVNPNFQIKSSPVQAARRSLPSTFRSSQIQNNQSLNRTSSRSTTNIPSVQRRSENANQQNSSRMQTQPANSTRRVDTQVNSNRR